MTDQPIHHAIDDPRMHFEGCTPQRPPGILTRLRTLGEMHRHTGCSNAQPWWANMWLGALLAGAAAGFRTPVTANAVDGFIAGVTVFLLFLLITDMLNPRRMHAFCELCGLCSVAGNVRPARTGRQARTRLTQAGWTLHPLGNRAHCPGHADVPFVYTRTR